MAPREERLTRYIATSVDDARSSLERALETRPIETPQLLLDLLLTLRKVPGHAARRKMVATLLRKATAKLAEEGE